jgi:DnaK suppressor protein
MTTLNADFLREQARILASRQTGYRRQLRRLDPGEVDPHLAMKADRTLPAVTRSLGRLADGTYGTCVGCGGPIAKERLKLIPAAERCTGCQREQEVDDG